MPFAAPARDEPLTDTELEVLRLTGRGFQLPAIARQLGFHKSTAVAHKRHICAKLGARNTTHAIPLAVVAGYRLWRHDAVLPPMKRELRFSEPEVVRLVLSGFSAESIGKTLWLSPGTVGQVALHAKDAMAVHSYGYGELAVRVLRHKLFSPEQLVPRIRPGE